jgi:hypothetical protein
MNRAPAPCEYCGRLCEPMPADWDGPPLCASCSPVGSPVLALDDPRQPWNLPPEAFA